MVQTCSLSISPSPSRSLSRPHSDQARTRVLYNLLVSGYPRIMSHRASSCLPAHSILFPSFFFLFNVFFLFTLHRAILVPLLCSCLSLDRGPRILLALSLTRSVVFLAVQADAFVTVRGLQSERLISRLPLLHTNS